MGTHVLIVDDHYMIAEGIRSLLKHEQQIELIEYADTASSCLLKLTMRQPDVILMDINLPDKNGIELCREVKTLYPSVFIIGLSTYSQQSFIEKMLESGADGYLLKNATRSELVDAITLVQKGKIYLNEEVSGILQSHEPGDIPIVTRREKEILQLIADGMTSIEIAGRLFISPATVETHRKNLVAKFNAKNTVSLIKAAMTYRLID
ncbi:MAG: response regulator transcription factor [Chitinophagaceae bacterium]|nr:response regulator transcription factor [Chitinophagaceae bacterium]